MYECIHCLIVHQNILCGCKHLVCSVKCQGIRIHFVCLNWNKLYGIHPNLNLLYVTSIFTWNGWPETQGTCGTTAYQFYSWRDGSEQAKRLIFTFLFWEKILQLEMVKGHTERWIFCLKDIHFNTILAIPCYKTHWLCGLCWLDNIRIIKLSLLSLQLIVIRKPQLTMAHLIYGT